MSDEIKCYANPAIAALFEASPDHEICNRCGCCDQVWDSCQCCGGDGFVESDEWDPWGDQDDYEECWECDGDGGWNSCLGRCDKNGIHEFYCPEHRYNAPDNSGLALCPQCEIAAMNKSASGTH